MSTPVIHSANVVRAGVQEGIKNRAATAAATAAMEGAAGGAAAGGIGSLIGAFNPVTMAISMALQAIYNKTKSTPSKNAGFLLSQVLGAKADQMFALDPFESGFQPYGFGRRTGQGDVTEISDMFRTVDSTLSNYARDAGLDVDYSTNRPFSGYDETGANIGEFYGYAGEKGKGGGTPLNNQLTQFAKQWVSGLIPAEERAAVDQAVTLEDVLNAAGQIFSYKKQGGVLTNEGWVNAEGELIGSPPLQPVGDSGGGGGQTSSDPAGGDGSPWVYDDTTGGFVNIQTGEHVGVLDRPDLPYEDVTPDPVDDDLDVNIGLGNGEIDFPIDNVLDNSGDGAGGDGLGAVDTGGTGTGTGTGDGAGEGSGTGDGNGDGTGDGDGSDDGNDMLSALLAQPGATATPNPMAPLADIKYYFDVGGDSIFAPTERDGLLPRVDKPYDSPKGYPQGDVDQLMRYLRG